MIDWLIEQFMDSESKKKVIELNKVINETCQYRRLMCFDSALFEAYYDVASIYYYKGVKSKANSYFLNALENFCWFDSIIYMNNGSKEACKLQDERLLILENRLLNLAQRVSLDVKTDVRAIVAQSDKFRDLLHPCVGNKYKIKKIKNIDVVSESLDKINYKLTFANNKDILDKKNLYIDS